MTRSPRRVFTIRATSGSARLPEVFLCRRARARNLNLPSQSQHCSHTFTALPEFLDLFLAQPFCRAAENGRAAANIKLACLHRAAPKTIKMSDAMIASNDCCCQLIPSDGQRARGNCRPTALSRYCDDAPEHPETASICIDSA
jgi:hypothetical protein